MSHPIYCYAECIVVNVIVLSVVWPRWHYLLVTKDEIRRTEKDVVDVKSRHYQTLVRCKINIFLQKYEIININNLGQMIKTSHK